MSNDEKKTSKEDVIPDMIAQDLAEVFPPEAEGTLSKGGAKLTYIPVAEVITRLNRVLGINNWSYEIRYVHRDPTAHDFAIAVVELRVQVGDTIIRRDGVGGQKLNTTRGGDIIDLGDDYKGAVSDALKKAAASLGVGLYLSRKEDAVRVETTLTNKVDQTVVDGFAKIKDFGSKMDDAAKKALREFWDGRTNKAPFAPKSVQDGVASIEDLEATIAEAARLTVGGEFVESSG